MRISMATTQWMSLVSFVMCIYGAKLEEHCFYISSDILFSVLYHN